MLEKSDRKGKKMWSRNECWRVRRMGNCDVLNNVMGIWETSTEEREQRGKMTEQEIYIE